MLALIEQRILRVSILITVVVAVAGIGFGFASGSFSIVYEGLFAGIDAVMSLLSLMVSKLVVKEVSRRFQQGYWHLEPMVLAVNAGVLVCLSIYAFVDSFRTFMNGGNELDFDSSMVYAVVVSVTSFAMYFTQRRLNKKVGSLLVALDVQSWLMSAVISLTLLFAFLIGYAVEGTTYQRFSPYIDPLLLAVLSIVLIPLPAITIIRSIGQILMITSSDLDREISELLSRMTEKYGFECFSYYVTQVGRGLFVEVHIVIPGEMDNWCVSDLDLVRDEISRSIGRVGPDRWLSIDFTRDPRWI